MSRDRIRVVARFAVQSEHVEAFKRLAKESLVAPTLREAGCLEYALCQDDADPTRFVMIETWETAKDLATHLALPSLQAAVAKLAPLAAEAPTVQRVRAV